VKPTAVPRTSRGVRTEYDRTREAHVVLFPEGVLVLNETAAAVLALCDGRTSVEEIARRLADDFTGVDVQDVTGLLERLADRRVVDLDG
jgi:pyrroloquinoline quinone biosynthesis protein D